MHAKEEFVSNMEKMKRLIPHTIKALDQLYASLHEDDVDVVNSGLYTTLPPGELRIELAYDMALYRRLRKAMGNNWIFTYRLFNEFIGAHFIYFEHKEFDVTLDIALELSQEFVEGQSCRLVVDHYQEPEPVYRVECE